MISKAQDPCRTADEIYAASGTGSEPMSGSNLENGYLGGRPPAVLAQDIQHRASGFDRPIKSPSASALRLGVGAFLVACALECLYRYLEHHNRGT